MWSQAQLMLGSSPVVKATWEGLLEAFGWSWDPRRLCGISSHQHVGRRRINQIFL